MKFWDLETDKQKEDYVFECMSQQIDKEIKSIASTQKQRVKQHEIDDMYVNQEFKEWKISKNDKYKAWAATCAVLQVTTLGTSP